MQAARLMSSQLRRRVSECADKLPCGVKQFVSLTLFDRWGKQMQQINGRTYARTKILLISFLTNQNNRHAYFLAFQASRVDVGPMLQKHLRSS